MNTVISLFDKSGIALKPWARAGYSCHAFDIQNPKLPTRVEIGRGSIEYHKVDLDSVRGRQMVSQVMRRCQPYLVLGWPPCEDLTRTGARHTAAKEKHFPGHQQVAANRAIWCAEIAEEHGARSMVENPQGKLSTLWRKPDHWWHPWEYGGLLPEDDEHPKWPKYIAPRDAYTKRTGAWVGGGFVMPRKHPVEPEILEQVAASGKISRGSRQFIMLGGGSDRAKEIRNLTPRGFALAVYLANERI